MNVGGDSETRIQQDELAGCCGAVHAGRSECYAEAVSCFG